MSPICKVCARRLSWRLALSHIVDKYSFQYIFQEKEAEAEVAEDEEEDELFIMSSPSEAGSLREVLEYFEDEFGMEPSGNLL